MCYTNERHACKKECSETVLADTAKTTRFSAAGLCGRLETYFGCYSASVLLFMSTVGSEICHCYIVQATILSVQYVHSNYYLQ